MSEFIEQVQAGDRIKITSRHHPSPSKNSPFASCAMIVEWVEVKDGIKEIWVRREENA
ncbi:MAG: hypothetical protein KGL39_54895 [Patescibacteria group bacterium]|nr:hypothetical protein [Patescibacteria group bacterium]